MGQEFIINDIEKKEELIINDKSNNPKDRGRRKSHLGDEINASRNVMAQNDISDGLSNKSDTDEFMELGDEIINQESPKLPPPTPISLKCQVEKRNHTYLPQTPLRREFLNDDPKHSTQKYVKESQIYAQTPQHNPLSPLQANI